MPSTRSGACFADDFHCASVGIRHFGAPPPRLRRLLYRCCKLIEKAPAQHFKMQFFCPFAFAAIAAHLPHYRQEQILSCPAGRHAPPDRLGLPLAVLADFLRHPSSSLIIHHHPYHPSMSVCLYVYMSVCMYLCHARRGDMHPRPARPATGRAQ